MAEIKDCDIALLTAAKEEHTIQLDVEIEEEIIRRFVAVDFSESSSDGGFGIFDIASFSVEEYRRRQKYYQETNEKSFRLEDKSFFFKSVASKTAFEAWKLCVARVLETQPNEYFRKGFKDITPPIVIFTAEFIPTPTTYKAKVFGCYLSGGTPAKPLPSPESEIGVAGITLQIQRIPNEELSILIDTDHGNIVGSLPVPPSPPG